MDKKLFRKKIVVLITILIMCILISLLCGNSKMSIIDCIKGLFSSEKNPESIIMQNVRLPRVIGAVLAGVGLSVSGILLQSVTDNHLASPNIIGVNSGAGMFTILCLFLFPVAFYVLPFIAFIGAFLTTILIIVISNKVNSSNASIILVGMAITTLFNGVISLISLIDNDVLSTYKYFSIGGLNGIDFKILLVPSILVIISIVIALLFCNKIEILSLGDELAISLGVNIKTIKIIAMLCSSCLAACVVCFAGLLGFVGLIVPHIARKIMNGKLKENLIASMIIGAILVLLADTLGRCIVYPSEVPVGIIMAFVGCPFFLYLILRGKKYVRN